MGDYISRETAILRATKGVADIFDAYNVKVNLQAIPAADVAEVVRCVDCKYDERCMVQEFVRDERIEPYDKTVFFCADGKHKDGGQDG